MLSCHLRLSCPQSLKFARLYNSTGFGEYWVNLPHPPAAPDASWTEAEGFHMLEPTWEEKQLSLVFSTVPEPNGPAPKQRFRQSVSEPNSKHETSVNLAVDASSEAIDTARPGEADYSSGQGWYRCANHPDTTIKLEKQGQEN